MKKVNMTSKEMQHFTTITFYTFTFMLIAVLFALPIMLSCGSPLHTTIITLLAAGFAFASMVVTLFQELYWLVSSDICWLFRKHSLPLMRLEKSGKIICRLQMKVFNFLKCASIIVVASYFMYRLTANCTIIFFNMIFNTVFMITSWIVIVALVADGIFIYLAYLFELVTNLIGYKKPTRVQKLNEETIQNFWESFSIDSFLKRITSKEKYVPKRLALKENTVSRNTFSLTPLVMEANIKLPKMLSAAKEAIAGSDTR